jgi:hypothetical protein
MPDRITVGSLLGDEFVDDFKSFDITEVQKVISSLSSDEVIDIAHAEVLQQKSLYAAEILIEYIAKLIKTVSYLESRISSVKNKTSLEYRSVDGKTTADAKKQAGESSPQVEELAYQLAKAKGSKALLEKKYEILIKSHHHFKDISSAQKRGMVSINSNGSVGWE